MPDDIPEGARLELQTFLGLGGAILDDPVKAASLAQLLVGFRYGADKAQSESPFIATDNGSTWRVRGSHPGTTVPFFETYTILYLDKKSATLLGWLHESEQVAPSLPGIAGDGRPP